MRALQNGQIGNIRNPHSTRPWQHVLEPLSGYLHLAEKLYTDGANFADAFNFGPPDDDAKSVQWIVEHLLQQWGEGVAWQMDCVAQPHESNHLRLDCSKARQFLDWGPRWTLEQALETIIFWHKAYERSDDMREISLNQIVAFQEELTV